MTPERIAYLRQALTYSDSDLRECLDEIERLRVAVDELVAIPDDWAKQFKLAQRAQDKAEDAAHHLTLKLARAVEALEMVEVTATAGAEWYRKRAREALEAIRGK